MREILFRGKEKDSGNWIEGYYIYISEGEGMYDRERHLIQTDYKGRLGPAYEVDSGTVSQYVGLKDRDGNKIFEGDILQSPVRSIGKKDDTLITITDIRKCQFAALYVSDHKIVGNIYDNPNYHETINEVI